MKTMLAFPNSASSTLIVFFFSVLFLGKSFSQPQYSTLFLTTTSPSSIPFMSNTDNKAQWVYLSTDFPAAPSGYISKIYFRESPSMLPVLRSFTNFTIKMGQTNLSVLPPGPWITSGMNTVFTANTFNVASSPGDWVGITLQTPFYYDNTKNFIVEASHAGYSIGFQVMQGSLQARSLYGNSMSMMANSQNFLCDFGFDISQGGTDAMPESIINLSDTMCEGQYGVGVILKNNGPANLTSVTINWSVNNVSQGSINWTGNLAVNDTANVNLGNISLQSANTYNVKVLTTNPNNSPDLNPGNDTTSFTVAQVLQAYPVVFSKTVIDICQGDSAFFECTFSGTPPWDLSITDNTNTFGFSGLTQAGHSFYIVPATSQTLYYYSATGSNSCVYEGSGPLTVNIHSHPVINLGGPYTILLSGQMTLDAGSGFDQYLWNTGDTTQQITIDCSVYGSGQHSFSVVVHNQYGCSGLDSTVVNVVDDTGIGEKSDWEVQLFPNPATDIIMLRLKEDANRNASITILNTMGAIVFYKEIKTSAGINLYEFDIGNLSDGLYHIVITNNQRIFQKTIIKR